MITKSSIIILDKQLKRAAKKQTIPNQTKKNNNTKTTQNKSLTSEPYYSMIQSVTTDLHKANKCS